ncbi:MAG: aminotransferase class I/II-fold pyridoxal phosphate-dependent enzyme [Clostridiales bacterium]|jgi:DNA-binding transcriptional MocR family regulator|nr:aminotransferase class I/II-fold pyridoxal phosphate-dependent enzyme [Clostridiales bacterium]
MKKFSQASKEELGVLREELIAEFEKIKENPVKLDMSRGKPGEDQLELSEELITCLGPDEYMAGGIDCRNYGGLDGLPEMKKILADILHFKPQQIIVGGNSSLSMMFDSIASNMTHGVRQGKPWSKQGDIVFLCPVPGYDRHFAICEYFHIKMIPIPMNENGPDMDIVENLVSTNDKVKGIWCVPKYSNPEGIVYSDETVRRMASLKPAADDFRIYWDDAYTIHHLYGKTACILNILDECEKAGNPNMAYVFASFSKVSFSGASISCIASSESNAEYIKSRLKIQTIGPDKINQLRHVKFFKDANGVLAQMDKHAAILRPKFDLIHEVLRRELAPYGICRWTKPEGGYFISFYSEKGCAKKIVERCKQCALTLTEAGATYPYGNDTDDSNIRIAPSYPSLEELKKALHVFCLCVKLVSAEKYLDD